MTAATVRYTIEPDGTFLGEQRYAIMEVGKHPDGGHPWAAEWLTYDEAEWLVDMLHTSADLATRLLAFVSDHPDASWTAIRMGWAMTEGATYAQAVGKKGVHR